MKDGVPTLWFWKTGWWSWNGATWERISPQELVSRVGLYMMEAKGIDGESFLPTTGQAGGLETFLEVIAFLKEKIEPPVWFERVGDRVGIEKKSARGIITFTNGNVDIETGEFHEHSPKLWNHCGLDFKYDPKASCERWMRYMAECLPGDEAGQNFLEEFGGYAMTWETKFHKAALLHGKPRAGKGTYLRMVKEMAGASVYAPLNIHTWASGENSSANIIGKKVLGFSDERLKGAKGGWEPGGLDIKSVTMLLKIIGGDDLPIGLKYEVLKWEGQILGKVIFISNEIPNFNDRTGALPGRFIGALFPINFEKEGRLDPDLWNVLMAERSGVANRWMEAYRRLVKRGKFIEPDAGRVIREAVEAKTRPGEMFFAAHFEWADKAVCPLWVLKPLWLAWAQKIGDRELAEMEPWHISRQLGKEVEGWSQLEKTKPGGREYWRRLRLRRSPKIDATLSAHARRVTASPQGAAALLETLEVKDG
jgi:putative DNA primase/helicase